MMASTGRTNSRGKALVVALLVLVGCVLLESGSIGGLLEILSAGLANDGLGSSVLYKPEISICSDVTVWTSLTLLS